MNFLLGTILVLAVLRALAIAEATPAPYQPTFDWEDHPDE